MSATHSTSETGHAQNLASLRTLDGDIASLGAVYNPANPALAAGAIHGLYITCNNAQQALIDATAPFTAAIASRKAAFRGYQAFATKIMSALTATQGVAPSILDNARSFNRKIQGSSLSSAASPAPPPAGSTPAPAPDHRISTSQQSHVFVVQHFRDLIALLAQVPAYSPNEAPLQITYLAAYTDKLYAENGLVADADRLYNDALAERNTAFYHPETGLVATAKVVKAYVKSIPDLNPATLRRIIGLPFVTLS